MQVPPTPQNTTETGQIKTHCNQDPGPFCCLTLHMFSRCRNRTTNRSATNCRSPALFQLPEFKKHYVLEPQLSPPNKTTFVYAGNRIGFMARDICTRFETAVGITAPHADTTRESGGNNTRFWQHLHFHAAVFAVSRSRDLSNCTRWLEFVCICRGPGLQAELPPTG